MSPGSASSAKSARTSHPVQGGRLQRKSKNALILITVLLRDLSQTVDWQQECHAPPHELVTLGMPVRTHIRLANCFHKAQFPPVYSWGLNVAVAAS
jgi:hypothetical protein